MKAIETGTLNEFLRPREKLSVATPTSPKKQIPRKASHSGSVSSNEPVTPTTSNIPPPVPIRKACHDEDEDLLREIEKELAQSDFSKVDFNF